MALNLPPLILQKTLATKTLEFKEGKLYLWATPCFIDPIQLQTYYHRLNEHSCGYKKANRIRYYTGKLQAMTGMKIVNQRFGYAKTISDKKRLLLFNAGQTELLGLGKFQWQKIDFKNELFMCNTISPFAEEYKRFYGMQKNPVDYWIMGTWAGTIESLTGKKMLGLEGSCIAKGDRYCQFIIRPVDKWNKSDNIFKKLKFLLKEEPGIKELGGSMKFYTKLK